MAWSRSTHLHSADRLNVPDVKELAVFFVDSDAILKKGKHDFNGWRRHTLNNMNIAWAVDNG